MGRGVAYQFENCLVHAGSLKGYFYSLLRLNILFFETVEEEERSELIINVPCMVS